MIKEVAHESPDREIESCCRRYPGKRAEEDWEVDLADDVSFALACIEPKDDRRDGADEEAPHKWSIGGVRAKEFSRPNDTPEYAAVEVNSSEWAHEAVDSLWGADILHIVEHPVEDSNLGD